jgi:hypothetical protein
MMIPIIELATPTYLGLAKNHIRCAAVDSRGSLALGWVAISHFWIRRSCRYSNVRLQHTGQLSIEEFHSPFGGKPDPNNRWVQLHRLIPLVLLESHYAPQFSARTGAPAKPFHMAFGGGVHPATIGNDGSRDGGADH